MAIKRGILTDVGNSIKDNQTYAVLYLKDDNRSHAVQFRYDPYFFAEGIGKEEILSAKVADEEGNAIKAKSVEEIERQEKGKKSLFKIFCHFPSDVPKLKDYIRKFSNATCYEYDIPYNKRVIIDFQLIPFSEMEINIEEDELKKIKLIDENPSLNLKSMAFDMEVYNPEMMPNSRKDPIIMISFADESETKVITTKGKDPDVIKVSSEDALISRFMESVELKDPDVIFGYNTSVFDIPYLLERAAALKMKRITLSRDKGKMRKISKGNTKGFDIEGRVHLDLYPVAKLFGRIGVFDTDKFTLYDVYKAVLGKEKLMVNRMNIWEMWDQPEQLQNLIDYSLMDSRSTYELGMALLPLEIELSKLSRTSLFDASLSTTGQFVENMLMFYAGKNSTIVPKKPNDAEVEKRLANPIEGAFVKLPEPGIYNNIAVLDFRGLYPSIITSYNIDPYTITEDEDSYLSPMNVRFSKKTKGLVPSVLKEILERRGKIKDQIKNVDHDSEEYTRLSARSQALKILANSFYGYLGYPKSRWYSRECASSVTAWGRSHIKQAEAEAEKQGFNVLYMDTDSLFILMNSKTERDVINFMEGINKNLPGDMKLELEDFYTRGVFVTKKGKDAGAKKKYALLSKRGKIKIRGFELVRRDWSKVARDTQREVLGIILKDGSKEKAVNFVNAVIKRLRTGTVPLAELVIYTQLNKEIRDYEVKSPELGAAKKLITTGVKLGMGSMISYVITKNGRTISEKAEPLEMAKNYDPEYYIAHQILPSVMKILKELGVNESTLANAGKQSALSDFFH